MKIKLFLASILFFNFVYAEVIDETNKAINDQKIITNLNAVQTAFNTSSATNNIKNCYYTKESICKIRLRERMPVVIQLPEPIESWVLGDSRNFSVKMVNRTKQLITVSALFAGADTNLTLVAKNNKLFSFYIRSDSIYSKFVSDFVVNVSDVSIAKNPNNEIKKATTENKKLDKQIEQTKKDYLEQKPNISPDKLSFNYEMISGDKELMPLAIFDDSIWTYFKYGNKNLNSITKLPAVYKVVDGYDTPANTRIEKGYLIVESISDSWTIRSGTKHTCVRKKI